MNWLDQDNPYTTVITSFPLDLEDKTKHGVVTNLFCLGVIGHRKSLSFYKIKIN